MLFAAGSAETFEAQSWFFDNAWLIPALPAASFVLILFFGKRLPYKGAEIGVASVVVALGLAILTAGAWIGQYENEQGDHSAAIELAADDQLDLAATEGAEGGAEHIKAEPIVTKLDWLSSNGRTFSIGTLVDGQSVMMLVVVTLISTLVHVFSTDYVAGDRRFTHYFAFLSLFTAAMLFMVLASSTLQLIVGWELVGVCSFVLIGHWWEDKANSDAAMKAFLTNRVGDIGLLIGVAILFFAADNTFDILTINEKVIGGEIARSTLTWAAICLMAAVMSKSGQFILHTWLPDAMAGPTPVSALIHAATMVVAGIYMVGRLYPVFWEGMAIAGSSVNLMALIGGITCVFGGALAFVQRDIKKVLAYSTVSQLGYMVMALGVGAWTAAMFHLFTHAIFKACLFLGAGSVSHACHHSFDMKADMGGLRKYMPTTHATFLIASGALAGIPPLAGFWSKDEILAGTGGWPGTDGNGTYYIVFAMGLLTAAMTAAYMARTIWLTFYGDYRGHETPHESGRRITVPLVILAFFAVIAGFLNVPTQWFGEGVGLKFEQWVEPAGDRLPSDFSHATPSVSLAIVASLLALGAGAYVWRYYNKLYAKDPLATEYTDGLASRMPLAAKGHLLLENKYYLDHLYTDTIAAGTKGPVARAAYWFNQKILDGVVDNAGKGSVGLGRLVYKYIDQGTIDASVNSTADGAGASGGILRRIQNGKIRQYATLMFGATAVLVAIFMVAV